MVQNKINSSLEKSAEKNKSGREKRKILWQGLAAAWPICLGYIPLGLALGVLGRQAGVPVWAVGMMSVLVFAGSAQFICVAMLAAGASFWSIVMTTFMVNLRHALMSSALSLYLQNLGHGFLALFSFGITDESFAINMARFQDREKGKSDLPNSSWTPIHALTLNQVAYAAWVLSTIGGAYVGQTIPVGAFGTDYALPAMFICLLMFQLRSLWFVLTAILSAGIAVAWYWALPGDSYIVGASLCGTTIGFFLQKFFHKKNRNQRDAIGQEGTGVESTRVVSGCTKGEANNAGK